MKSSLWSKMKEMAFYDKTRRNNFGSHETCWNIMRGIFMWSESVAFSRGKKKVIGH